MPDGRAPITWRDRLSDPWYVLPLGVLAGAVVALSLAILLEPDDGISSDRDVAVDVATTALTSSSPDATPVIDAALRQRDLARGADAYRIAQAAFAYYRDHDAFPATAGGALEPLCANDAIDAGCKFAPYVTPVPMDVRGSPAANGYWYQSDGAVSALYISMESGDALDQASCPAPLPPGLAEVPHLYCLPINPPAP